MKAKVSILIEAENGKFTQRIAGAIPIKSNKIETYDMEAESLQTGLIQVLTNVGAVFIRSQTQNEDTFSKYMTTLKDNRDALLKNLSLREQKTHLL
jgi:hypothetical protein